MPFVPSTGGCRSVKTRRSLHTCEDSAAAWRSGPQLGEAEAEQLALWVGAQPGRAGGPLTPRAGRAHERQRGREGERWRRRAVAVASTVASHTAPSVSDSSRANVAPGKLDAMRSTRSNVKLTQTSRWSAESGRRVWSGVRTGSRKDVERSTRRRARAESEIDSSSANGRPDGTLSCSTRYGCTRPKQRRSSLAAASWPTGHPRNGTRSP